jgi:hypothetical protein
MSRQIKCTKCGNWNNAGLNDCETCSNSLHLGSVNETKKEDSNSYKEFVGKLKGQSDWIDELFIKAKTGNVFIKGLAYFLQFLWMVYFSLLLFVAWLVFIVAG